jgi:hypothetical protein
VWAEVVVAEEPARQLAATGGGSGRGWHGPNPRAWSGFTVLPAVGLGPVGMREQVAQAQDLAGLAEQVARRSWPRWEPWRCGGGRHKGGCCGRGWCWRALSRAARSRLCTPTQSASGATALPSIGWMGCATFRSDASTRSGAPREIGHDRIEPVISRILESLPADGTPWSSPGMAKASGLCIATAQRIRRALGPQPHRVEGFKLSTAPDFVAKARDVVGADEVEAGREVTAPAPLIAIGPASGAIGIAAS